MAAPLVELQGTNIRIDKNKECNAGNVKIHRSCISVLHTCKSREATSVIWVCKSGGNHLWLHSVR